MLKKPNEDGIMKAIPSYYDIKKLEREEAERVEFKELHELFKKALNFYNENYPNSFQKPEIKRKNQKKPFLFEDKKSFMGDIKTRNIEDKLLARFILLYSIQERNYKLVNTYYKYNELRGKIKNLIPGGDILEKIEKIELEKRKKEEELIELKKELSEALMKEKKEKIETKPITSIKCDLCEKECNSAAGLASHKRSAHPKTENKDEIQNSDNLTII